MELKNNTYYWVLPLNSGKWQVAYYQKLVDAKDFTEYHHFYIDGKHFKESELGQIGEEIPSNQGLFEMRKILSDIGSITKITQEAQRLANLLKNMKSLED